MNAVPTIDLNDGRTIPQLGFGVFQVPPKETEEVFVGCPEVKNGYMLAQEKPGLGIDFDEKLARRRYRVFKEQTWDALLSLKDIFYYHLINAEGPLAEGAHGVLLLVGADALEEEVPVQVVGLVLEHARRHSLVGKLAKNPGQRTDSVAGNEPGCVIEQLPRDIGNILKVDVPDFSRTDLIEILELVVAGPEVIAVKQRSKVRMRR